MDEIKKSLLNIHSFTDEQISVLKNNLTIKLLNKGDYLLRPDQKCSFIAFVNTGSLRYYTWTDNDEQTLHFFSEHNWLTDYEYLISQQPSVNHIQAIEKTELSLLTLTDLHQLLELHPEFRNILKLLDKAIITSKHLSIITNSTPDERYKNLLATNPEWINRFPQQHIASYLGMTKETFSRVKSRVR